MTNSGAPIAYGISLREMNFVRNLIAGAEVEAAAVAAGYAPSTAKTYGNDMLRRPRILAAIYAESRKRLVELVPLALGVCKTLASDAELAPKVRLDAAKTILDRAGLIPPRAQAAQAADRPLNELSVDELRALADKLEGELAARATPVESDSAPNDAPLSASALEMIS